MASSGDNHGGNGKTAEECRHMLHTYVDGVLQGKGKCEAARDAGYAAQPANIEDRNRSRIIEELDRRRMDEPWMADQYAECIQRIKDDKDRTFDGQAFCKTLLQIGYLRGHGKKDGPQIAIQQNFGGKSEPDERKRTEDLLARVEDTIRRVEERLGDAGSAGVHAGDSEPIDAQAHHDVDGTGQEGALPAGGGQP